MSNSVELIMSKSKQDQMVTTMRNDLKTIMSVMGALRNSVASMKSYLYRINKSKDGAESSRFALELKTETLNEYIADLVEPYLNLEDEYEGVDGYAGNVGGNRLQWLNVKDPLVNPVWESIANSPQYAEKEWIRNLGKSKSDPKGLLLYVEVLGHSVTLIMDLPPCRRLKHVLSLSAKKFKVVEGPFLVLPLKIDTLRIDDRLYFFTKRGFSIFLLPGAISISSEEAVKEILATGKIKDEEVFAKYARAKCNPRRLLNFKDGGMDKLLALSANTKNGNSIRQAFGIEFKGGKLVPEAEEDVERVIKMITGRGMIDPFSRLAMEVSDATTWRK